MQATQLTFIPTFICSCNMDMYTIITQQKYCTILTNSLVMCHRGTWHVKIWELSWVTETKWWKVSPRPSTVCQRVTLVTGHTGNWQKQKFVRHVTVTEGWRFNWNCTVVLVQLTSVSTGLWRIATACRHSQLAQHVPLSLPLHHSYRSLLSILHSSYAPTSISDVCT
jgi:uncharacterized membrane protein YsdA (DUF1294 family)